MSKQRNALKAGIFIMVSVILALAVVVGIKGFGQFFEPIERRSAVFSLEDNLGGLRAGDDVRIGGFRVGDVRRIELVDGTLPAAAPTTNPTQGKMLRITFAIPKKYNLRQGARVAVESSLTGQSCLNFTDLGSPTADLLGADDYIRGVPSGLSAAMASLPQILEQVNTQTIPTVNSALVNVRDATIPRVNTTVEKFGQTADAGTALVKHVNEKVDPVHQKVTKVADSTSGMMDEVKSLIGDSKTDFRGTVANLNAATGSVKEKLPVILDKVTKVMTSVDTTITSASEAMEDVKKVAANTRDLTGSAKTIITGNKGKIDGMIASLNATSSNMKFATAELRHSPWRLLYKPNGNETANLNLYDSARQFADGANSLNDAAQALRDAAKDKDADPEAVKKLMGELEKRFENFREVEQKLWSAVKD